MRGEVEKAKDTSCAGNSSEVWLGGPLEKRDKCLGEVVAQVSFPRRPHANFCFCHWRDESPMAGTLNARIERLRFPRDHSPCLSFNSQLLLTFPSDRKDARTWLAVAAAAASPKHSSPGWGADTGIGWYLSFNVS